MRELDRKQKGLLNKWYKKNKYEVKSLYFEWCKCDVFSLELYEQLEKINNFETLSQDINRYLIGKKIKRS